MTVGDYKRTYPPRPMTDPCLYCPKDCESKEDYKCELFRIMYIIEWNETVTFLKERLGLKKGI